MYHHISQYNIRHANAQMQKIYHADTSGFGSYDVNDDVITYNHCRKFGAKYLGNEAR